MEEVIKTAQTVKEWNLHRRIWILLILVLVLPAAMLAAELWLPELYGDSYYAQLPRMVRKLKEAGGPRIIVIGGSNAAFGLNAAQLEEELSSVGVEYTVCNFGLYGAVGSSVMLNLAEPYLGEGDIVILAFEPVSEAMSVYFGANAFWKCMEDAPELFFQCSRTQQAALVGEYLPYLQERLKIVDSGIYPQVQGVYAKASFDEGGDMVYERPGNIMELGFDTSAMVDFSQITIEEAFAEQVNEFIGTAAEKGARVYLSFSPVNASALAGEEETAVHEYFRLLQDTFHCTVISDPNRYIWESCWFYDSNFHLNSPGAVWRTHQLGTDILAALGIFREPAWDPPEAPETVFHAAEEVTGDGEDFLYEPIGENGLYITSLSEKGMEKDTLAVPESYEGKRVVGFRASVFADNPVLVQLTLPESIEEIPDGAFSGSNKLSRLVLLHTRNTCAIGDGPFAGADGLKVYVPAESYSLYRDGTGCTENKWQEYLDRIIVN